jgi:hypothetical protein
MGVPVAVEVAAYAGTAWLFLSILAPHAVHGLAVDEACDGSVSGVRKGDRRHTIRIDHGKDIKVEFVKCMFNIFIELVQVQKIVCNVLGDHGTDPFPCMHGAEEDNGGIDAWA